MVYKKFSNLTGNYVDKDNKRFDVLETEYAFTPEGVNIGWTEFESMEKALEEWGLTYDPLPESIYQEPDESGLLQESEINQ